MLVSTPVFSRGSECPFNHEPRRSQPCKTKLNIIKPLLSLNELSGYPARNSCSAHSHSAVGLLDHRSFLSGDYNADNNSSLPSRTGGMNRVRDRRTGSDFQTTCRINCTNYRMDGYCLRVVHFPSESSRLTLLNRERLSGELYRRNRRLLHSGGKS